VNGVPLESRVGKVHKLLFVSSPMPEPGMFATAIARRYSGDEWEVQYACDVIRPMMDNAAHRCPHDLCDQSEPQRHG
jgi:hypothetical protein